MTWLLLVAVCAWLAWPTPDMEPTGPTKTHNNRGRP